MDKKLSYYNSHDYREGLIRVPGVRWFTNLEHGRRHQPLQLMTVADNINILRLEGVDTAAMDELLRRLGIFEKKNKLILLPKMNYHKLLTS